MYSLKLSTLLHSELLTKVALTYYYYSGTIQTQLLAPDKGHTSLVQLTVRNESGILCDDGWSDPEASVICQEHGYKRGKASKVKTDRVDYVATQLSCQWSNQALESCSYLNHTTADLQCRKGGAACVICYNGKRVNNMSVIMII